MDSANKTKSKQEGQENDANNSTNAPSPSAADPEQTKRASLINDIIASYFNNPFKVVKYGLLKDGTIKGVFTSEDKEYEFILKETGISYKLTEESKTKLVKTDSIEFNSLYPLYLDQFINSYGLKLDDFYTIKDLDERYSKFDAKVCGIGLLCGDTCIDKDKQCDLNADPNQQAKTKELLKSLGNTASTVAQKGTQTIKEHAPDDINAQITNQIGGLIASALPEIPVLSEILSEVSGDIAGEVIARVTQMAKGGATSQPLSDVDKAKTKSVKDVANNLLNIAKEMGKNSIEELKGMSAAEWAGYATQKGITIAASSAATGLTSNPLVGYAVSKAVRHASEKAGEFVTNKLKGKGSNSSPTTDADDTSDSTNESQLSSYRLAKGQELKELVEDLISAWEANVLLLIEKNSTQSNVQPPLKLVYYDVDNRDSVISGIVKDKAKHSFYFELKKETLDMKPMNFEQTKK